MTCFYIYTSPYYRAGLDVTIFNWYKELMEQHPSAKVLLTVRDPHKWYASMKTLQTCSSFVVHQPYAMVMRMMGMGGFVDFGSIVWSEKCPGVIGRVVRAMEAGEEEAVALFKAHVEEVRRYIITLVMLINR